MELLEPTYAVCIDSEDDAIDRLAVKTLIGVAVKIGKTLMSQKAGPMPEG